MYLRSPSLYPKAIDSSLIAKQLIELNIFSEFSFLKSIEVIILVVSSFPIGDVLINLYELAFALELIILQTKYINI